MWLDTLNAMFCAHYDAMFIVEIYDAIDGHRYGTRFAAGNGKSRRRVTIRRDMHTTAGASDEDDDSKGENNSNSNSNSTSSKRNRRRRRQRKRNKKKQTQAQKVVQSAVTRRTEDDNLPCTPSSGSGASDGNQRADLQSSWIDNSIRVI